MTPLPDDCLCFQGDPNFCCPKIASSDAYAGEIFTGTSEWQIPRQLDGHDPRAAATADTTVAFTGRHSLKIRVPTDKPLIIGVAGTQHSKGGGADACFGLDKSTDIAIRLVNGRSYSVSLQAQASPAGSQLAVMEGYWRGGCAYPDTAPAPDGGCPFIGNVRHEISMGREWTALQVNFTSASPDNCTGLAIRVTPPAGSFGAVAWIDAVGGQLLPAV